MEMGFIIWSVVALVLVGIGIWDWNSKTAVGFYSGIKPPEVRDVIKYNHAVAKLWFIYALIFEVLGLPLIFMEQNSPLFIISIIGVVFSVIGLAVAYTLILAKHTK